eukprot:m.1101152 g.1101152  ORF g.1101152 m.1101152 type:complete len:154 (+) comp24322_c0_seq13:3161-3622(+)
MDTVADDITGRWTACSQALNDAYSCADTLVSVVPLYAALLARGHAVLVYSGDVDGVVPTRASTRWLASMAIKKEEVTPWQPWLDGSGQIGGWSMSWATTVTRKNSHQHNRTTMSAAGNLVFATVRGAGHEVPEYQPERALELIRRFLSTTNRK